MSALRWLATRDRDFVALRRAGRTAIVMPAMFALGDKAIGNPIIATYAAFGSFAMLLLVDFGGPIRVRLQNQIALGLVGGVFVSVGTLASRATWLAALAMALVAFAVLFSSIVSSVLAAATTSLLLAFILPVTLRAPISSIPDRLAGWAMAAGASVISVMLLWPAPSRYPLRRPVIDAAGALAARLRSDVGLLIGGETAPSPAEHEETLARAKAATGALRKSFFATPYRPTGLNTTARTIVRLVDEIAWLDAIISSSAPAPGGAKVNLAACDVRLAAAQILDLGAQLLDDPGGKPDQMHEALAQMHGALAQLEHYATVDLPVARSPVGENPDGNERIAELVSSLDPSFRAQELSFAVSQIASNIELAAAADRRTWFERLTGRQPAGLTSTLSAAQERAASHVEWHSVTLHNSVRGAVGLGLAVLVADLTGVQHSFWVVLGTLSVLRSNALNTGQNVLRGLLGTVAGFVIGAGVLELIGTNSTLLWVLLPISILVAGIAPAAISFAAGQAGFTVVLVILFNIIQPLGWRVGLLRVEDITIGCAVSLAVGLLFWPRGAAAALRQALSEAYRDSARYLAGAVEFAVACCDASLPAADKPNDAATRAASAARRLDDTFRGFLAERGAKPLPLAEVTGLVTGVVGLRLAADAVLDLWQEGGSGADGDRTEATIELLSSTRRVASWYEDLASSLADANEVPVPLERDAAGDQRLINAVRRDLVSVDGRANATAVRMIWTGDHIDAVRRLQVLVAEPARAATEQRALTPSFR